MAVSNKKSRKRAEVKNDFEFEEEDIEVCSITEGEPILEGALLRSFVFDDSSSEPIEVDLTSDNTALTINNSKDNNTDNLPATNIASVTNNNSTATTSTQNSNIEHNINLSNKKISSKSEPKEDISDYRFLKTNPCGKTPPVDGEAFDMVRCYTLRRSTVRILSKIKAIHQDDNVYLNTIVDEAIRHYYEHLKNSNL